MTKQKKPGWGVGGCGREKGKKIETTSRNGFAPPIRTTSTSAQNTARGNSTSANNQGQRGSCLKMTTKLVLFPPYLFKVQKKRSPGPIAIQLIQFPLFCSGVHTIAIEQPGCGFISSGLPEPYSCY